MSVQGVVYELIGIVSSDSDSETSFENYLVNSDKLQEMPWFKQTPRKPRMQGTRAMFSPSAGETSNPETGADTQGDTEDTDIENQGEKETGATPATPVGKQPRKLIPKTPLRKPAPPSLRHTSWQKIAWWNTTAQYREVQRNSKGMDGKTGV